MFPWTRFFLYVLATAATPGPNTLSSLSVGSRLGFRGSLPYIFGIWTCFSIVSTACTILCSTLEALIPKIRFPMMVLGSCYILYLAWKLWRSGSITEVSTSKSGFRDGFLLQFVNVKLYIFCIVSMQTYVIPLYHGQIPQLLFFAMLLPLLCLVINFCWSGFGSLLRVLFSRYAKIINRIMALLLVWCAVRLFF